MAGCMAQLLDDPAMAMELGRRGKERIRNHFSMGHHIGGLNELIRSCVEGR
jgi:hypothetical protein